MHSSYKNVCYLIPEESPVAGSTREAQAAALQEDDPAIGTAVSPQEEASPGVIVAESSGVFRFMPHHHIFLVQTSALRKDAREQRQK